MITEVSGLLFADRFFYQNNILTSDGILIPEIIGQEGTPTFVYNLDAATDRFFEWQDAFGELPHRICYAVKANSSLALLNHLKNAGSSFDVNSRGELYRVKCIGADSGRITMTGVGKTKDDIAAALSDKILFLNVESFEECRLIQSVAEQMNTSAQIVLRINPEVDAHTHPYIATGLAEHKFGLCAEDAKVIIPQLLRMKNIKLAGFGMHIGSQIPDSSPFAEALSKLLIFIDEIRDQLHEPVLFINIGGGAGVPYSNAEGRLSIREFVNELKPLFLKSKATIVAEPGRHLVANAGILLTKVLYVKKTKTKTFVIVDAGMNDLIRPALYDAHHEIHAVEIKNDRQKITADIVGPVCETGDYFAHDRSIPEVKEGEYLAIFSAGAYGSTMSSRYNSRPFAAEIAIADGKYFLARERESLEDMVRLEKMK